MFDVGYSNMKEKNWIFRYIQVGNAVAVPVGVALGYAFGLASQGLSDNQPVIKLPFMYPQCMQGKAEEHSA